MPAESSSTIVPLVTFFLNTLQFFVIKTFLIFANIVGTTNLFFLQVCLSMAFIDKTFIFQAGMNIFFLFGQAAWIPETKAPNCSTESGLADEHSASYGTFVASNVAVNRYSFARERQGAGQDLEIVLNSTEFVVTISKRDPS